MLCGCGALVKRLRRGPLKAKTRVRFSYALPQKESCPKDGVFFI